MRSSLLLMLVGCGGAIGPASGGSGVESGGAESADTVAAPAECAALPVDECADRDDCQQIMALEIHERDGELCVDYGDERVAKGCLDAGMMCGMAITYAAPADDPSDCWWFSNTCIPEGWGPCDPLVGGVGECSEASGE